MYKTNNVGGVPGAPEYIYDVYFGFPDDTTVVLPSQGNPLGDALEGKDVAYIPSTSTFEWVVIGSGYGTALRRFVKK